MFGLAAKISNDVGHNKNASSGHYLSESEVGSGIEIGVNWQTHSRSPTHIHMHTYIYTYIYIYVYIMDLCMRQSVRLPVTQLATEWNKMKMEM